MNRPFRSAVPLIVALLLAGSVLAACGDHRAPTAPGDLPAQLNKKGGGTTTPAPVATFYLPTTQGGLGLWGDAVPSFSFSPDGGTTWLATSRYVHQECGVETRFYLSGTRDAILFSNGHKGSMSKCSFAPRRASVKFLRIVEHGLLDQGTFTPTVFLNTFNLTSVAGEEPRPMHIGMDSPNGTNLPCDDLRFRDPLPQLGNVVTGADLVTVQRVDSLTWRVYNTPDKAKAACIKDGAFTGALYHTPVDFYLTIDRPIP